MRGTHFVLVVGLALLPLSAHAAATLPAPDSGRIDLGAGWRFLADGNGPDVGGRFSWHMSPSWSLGIDLGFGRVPIALESGDATLLMTEAGFALQWFPAPLGPVLPYLSGGMAYEIVSLTEGDAYREGATAALDLGAGAWLPLTDTFGLFAEGRWRFGNLGVQVGGTESVIGIGGAAAWGGVVVVFGPEPPMGI